jgi:hypothetical protein
MQADGRVDVDRIQLFYAQQVVKSGESSVDVELIANLVE